MWSNIWMSLTNIYGLRAIYNVWLQDEKVNSLIILGAVISSSVYHLVECEKHKMSGIGLNNSKELHYITLNIDRFFAVLTFMIMFLKARETKYELIRENMMLEILALSSLFLSEIPFRYEKPMYMITHTIWHISAYHLVYLYFK